MRTEITVFFTYEEMKSLKPCLLRDVIHLLLGEELAKIWLQEEIPQGEILQEEILKGVESYYDLNAFEYAFRDGKFVGLVPIDSIDSIESIDSNQE